MTTLRPADMSDEQLEAALRRLAGERKRAGGPRRMVIGRVCDVVLDEVLERRADG